MEGVVRVKYEEWINSSYLAEQDKEELKSIREDEKEIIDRFYKDLDFGTGGLRGVRGVGTNRINVYVIRKATQGLANYMLKSDPQAKEKGIVIAYDSRIGSTEFALNAALVMAANGIKAYLFESLRPTPELSFAVRELKALSGIVVTASHNPPEYNGYKVYWDDGAQVVAPHDKLIIGEVNAIKDFAQVKFMDETEAKNAGLLTIVGEEIDAKFIAELKKLAINPEVVEKVADTFKLVFTPLSGTGNIPVRRILKEIGFKNVYIVAEEEQPDGNFPTVGYPNPEEPAVFKNGIKLAEETGSTLVMATDPDADRIGIAVKSKTGEWIYPNGNQVGVLLTEYILKNLKDRPANGAVVTTVVSTPMIDIIGKYYGVKIYRTLTGFKFIGEKIKEFENGHIDNTFIFGFEESYGYLRGTHARDKDAIVAAMLIAEMAAFFESTGTTIEEELESLYKKYGYAVEGIKAITMKGKEGAEKITNIMNAMRTETPDRVAGKKVVIVRDFLNQVEKHAASNTNVAIELPKSDVLQFVLEDESVVTARPSGTEPKIKFYFAVKGDTKETAEESLKVLMEKFLKNME